MHERFISLANHKNKPEDYRRAKDLRQDPAPAEQIFWNKLRRSEFNFRRQHPLNPYIVDFVCLRLKLVIEIDGASHDAKQKYDRKRETYLSRLGFTVLRFSDAEVLRNAEGVACTIFEESRKANLLHPSPNPSRKGRGTPLL